MSDPADRAAAWDAAYERSDHTRMWDMTEPAPELVGFVAASPPAPGDRALDLGCGTGSDALFLARQGFAVTGVDVSAIALELARQRAHDAGTNANWVCADVTRLPLPEASFELITDRGCLHHLPDSSRAEYAAEVARILVPGGRLFLRGMSEAGRRKHAVSHQTLAPYFDNAALEVRFSTTFDMAGPAGAAPALLAVIERA